MRAMRAEQFSGYEGLKLVDLAKPAVTDGKVLVRITAAGVTPLDHTVLSGKFHGSREERIRLWAGGCLKPPGRKCRQCVSR
jgi:NADPH:quinone reductase-like Zn-dependent oxidoreductase